MSLYRGQKECGMIAAKSPFSHRDMDIRSYPYEGLRITLEE
jgi:hypothetical protein